MSRRVEEGTVNLGEIDDIACDVARYMKDKGVPGTIAPHVVLFMYAKCVALNDVDEEQAVACFRALLKQLRVLRPS